MSGTKANGHDIVEEDDDIDEEELEGDLGNPMMKALTQSQVMEMLTQQFQSASKLENRFNDLKNKYDKLRGAKTKTDKELGETQSKLAAEKERSAALSSDLEAARKELAQLQLQLAQAQAGIRDLNLSIENVKKEREEEKIKTEGELQELRDKSHKLESELKNEKEKSEALVKENEELSMKYTRVVANITETLAPPTTPERIEQERRRRIYEQRLKRARSVGGYHPPPNLNQQPSTPVKRPSSPSSPSTPAGISSNSTPMGETTIGHVKSRSVSLPTTPTKPSTPASNPESDEKLAKFLQKRMLHSKNNSEGTATNNVVVVNNNTNNTKNNNDTQKAATSQQPQKNTPTVVPKEFLLFDYLDKMNAGNIFILPPPKEPTVAKSSPAKAGAAAPTQGTPSTPKKELKVDPEAKAAEEGKFLGKLDSTPNTDKTKAV